MLDDYLKKDFEDALLGSRGSHATWINSSFLGVYKRVASVDPTLLDQVVDIYQSCIRAHRSNLVASLFALIQLADVNNVSKQIISEKFPEDLLIHYENDGDSEASGNAKILRAVLGGASLTEFQTERSTSNTSMNNVINNSQVHFGSGDNVTDVISTSHNDNTQKASLSLFERMTNNQSFAIVIGGLFLLLIIYLIFTKFGINLSQFR